MSGWQAWCPTCLIRARGQHRFAGGPFAPPAAPGSRAQQARRRLDLPGILAPLRLLSVPAARPRPGDSREPSRPHVDRRRQGPLPRHRPGGLGPAGAAGRRVGRAAGLPVHRGKPADPRPGPAAPGPGVRRRAALLARCSPRPRRAGPGQAASPASCSASATLTTARREAYLAFTMDAPPRPRPGQGGRRRRPRRGGRSWSATCAACTRRSAAPTWRSRTGSAPGTWPR